MQFCSPLMTRRMGRPPLNVEETKVRLNAGTKERITALVGAHRMSAYIREAVEEKLRRDEKLVAGKLANPADESD